MKRHFLQRAGLVAAVAFGAITGTATAAAPAVDASALGVAESALNVCGRVDASAAAKLQERINQLTQGVSADDLAQARSTDAYRSAFETVADYVGKVSDDSAKAACSETIVEGK